MWVSVRFLRRHEKIRYVKVDGQNQSRAKTPREGQTNNRPTSCKSSAGQESRPEMSDRSKHEIEILRRILFSLEIDQLNRLRDEFVRAREAELPGLALGFDQECMDYLDWLIRRQEML